MMRTRTLSLAFATSAMALALAACSADADPGSVSVSVDEAAAPAQTSAETSAAGPTPEVDAESRPTDDSMEIHPCLLTGDEVAGVLGGHYGDGVLNADFSGFPNYICDYTNTDTGVATVAVTAIMPRGFSAEQQRPGYEEVYDDVVDVTLAGADYAFTAGAGTVVAAQVGEYTIFVGNLANGDSDPDGNTLRLAQIAVGNV